MRFKVRRQDIRVYDTDGKVAHRIPGVLVLQDINDAALRSLVERKAGYFFADHPEATEVELELDAQPVGKGRDPWVPYLVDRADGVRGHYAIGRIHGSGYVEYWNLRKHCWASASDDVLTREAADALLKAITIPTIAHLDQKQEAAIHQAVRGFLSRRDQGRVMGAIRQAFSAKAV